jgi:putative ABC transport system permease protein
MFRSYLAAAWHVARRDRFYAVLNVVGLGLGFAAAILIWLFVRDELSFDRFLPGYENVYRAQLTFTETGRRPETMATTPYRLAAEMALEFPEIAASVRIRSQNLTLSHGEVEANEAIKTADADFFAVLGFPLLRGDPATALAEPGSIVLTRRLAEKYFGTVDCLGQSLTVGHHDTVRVTGIAEDPPVNTTNGFSALLSGKTPYSRLAEDDRQPPWPKGEFWNNELTLFRLKPATAPGTLAARFPGFVLAHYPQADGVTPFFSLFLKPLADVHLHPNDPDTGEIDERAQTVGAVAATGVLILLLAGINFVNLITARATRRAIEVGVRKALGAARRQLLAQFMTESVCYALAGMMLGMALAELAVPGLNAALDRQIAFDYWRHPVLAGLPLATAILVGLVAGIYPALVLSRFPPALVLKSRSGGSIGGGKLRLVLVICQFTVTIALLIATSVIYRQNSFATSQALGFDKDLMLTVELSGMPLDDRTGAFARRLPAPVQALQDRLAALPGVQAVAASWAVPQPTGDVASEFDRPAQPDRPKLSLKTLSIGFGFFPIYGLNLIAGRDFARDHAEDMVAADDLDRVSSAIINQTAMHALGFTDADAALGQEIATGEAEVPHRLRIIGVAPDFPLGSIRKPVPPSVFFVQPGLFNVLSLKLSGASLPDTLRGIDAVWADFVPERPITRSFVDDRIARLYLDETREGRLFAAFAGFAALIGCLGLVGLSAYTAERRTKEIGIRKVLGASTLDVTGLLIWQFVKPVLLANALAWPIAWWFMRRWLDGFAYRIELDPTPFLAAGLASLAIAVATTAFHAFQVARSRPVLALRYE